MASDKPLFGDQIASGYEDWYKTAEGRRTDVLEKRLLRQLLEQFPYAQSVLEVGCGTGHFSRWLSAQNFMAVGLDLSAEMLAQAQMLGDGPWVQGDALSLPFADDSFDLVILITTLEFLTRPHDALEEALRVARQGLLLGVLNRWSLLGLERRVRGLFSPTIYNAAHFYGVGELGRLLRSIAGEKARIVWDTTLFPRGWPCPRVILPWGGFIGMALLLSEADRQQP